MTDHSSIDLTAVVAAIAGSCVLAWPTVVGSAWDALTYLASLI
ncbi:MAG: hypothetical protein ACRD0P_25160 [Stackebrandtia sp.]